MKAGSIDGREGTRSNCDMCEKARYFVYLPFDASEVTVTI